MKRERIKWEFENEIKYKREWNEIIWKRIDINK